jgi:N,N'-diacetyllegionaminate synthase
MEGLRDAWAMPQFAEEFRIEERSIGKGHAVYVIAEAGVAHFGDEGKAYGLVDLAAEAGADAVKFQVFDVNALISEELPEWRARLGPRQLPYAAFERIQAYCRTKDITFFATAHDEPSLEFLSSLDVPAYKVGSGEVGNWPFLRRVASLGKPVIVSTGMYHPAQIGEALATVAGVGNAEIALLHCVTSYPTPPEEVGLGNVAMLREQFEVITGYSDHTRGFHFCLAAVALGAKIIEKHISLDFDVPNAQDWKVSCGPHDLARFITELREVEAGLGGCRVGPSNTERENMEWARKSLVTVRAIAANTLLSADDLTAKRPGSGISPALIGDVVGKATAVDLPRDAVVRWEHLK